LQRRERTSISPIHLKSIKIAYFLVEWMMVKSKKVFYIIFQENVSRGDLDRIKNSMDLKLMIKNYTWVTLKRDWDMGRESLKHHRLSMWDHLLMESFQLLLNRRKRVVQVLSLLIIHPNLKEVFKIKKVLRLVTLPSRFTREDYVWWRIMLEIFILET